LSAYTQDHEMSHKQGMLAMLYFWLQQILTLYEVQMVVAYHINKS